MRMVSAPGLLPVMLCILALSLAAPLTARVITFKRTCGTTSHDWGYSMAKTADGGYIIVGITTSFGAGNWDAWLIKTDVNGDTLWTRTYGGTFYEGGYSVAQTLDGGYVIVGHSSSFGAGEEDVYLVKTDASGDTVWTRTYGGTRDDYGRSVKQTADGGYILAGYTRSFGAGNYDAWLIKTDANGDTVWTRTYGGTGWNWGRSVAQTMDGGYIVGGNTGGDIWLVKTDASGDTMWTRAFGKPWSSTGYSVAQTADGGYIITGFAGMSPVENRRNVWLIKTDSNGDTMWTRNYGGNSYDYGHSVAQTTDGGYVITGRTASFGAGKYDVWLLKTDAWGDTMWTRVYGGAFDDVGHSVLQTADGGYVIAGETASFGAGRQDAWLIKTDADGRVVLAKTELPTTYKPTAATIARAVLYIRKPSTRYSSLTLLNPLGRKVMDLQPGPNDVRHISPGAYFVRQIAGQNSRLSKVVVTH